MALFGKKKGETPAPASTSTAPETAAPVNDAGAFDFDAISRDLDAQGGASSFDALLAQPAQPAPTNAGSTANSAFDFPEADPLQVAPTPPLSPSTRVSPTVPLAPQAAPVAPLPESVVNAPLSPIAGTVPVQSSPVTPVPMTVVPVPPAPRAKKSLPLVPILGALGLLAVVGGGAKFFLNSQKEPVADDTLVAPRPRRVATPPGAPKAPAANTAISARPAGGAPPMTLRAASPGIAPPASPIRPKPSLGSGATSQISVGMASKTATPGTAKLPSATAGLDAGLANKLKALWQAGADAKHRKDFKTARSSWQEALRLHPNHPGFQDAINKLPR